MSRSLLLLAAVLLFAGGLRTFRLAEPPAMVFDEIYYAKAARQYLAGQEITEEITHPPMSKLLIAAGMAVAGDRSLGWRLAPAASGTLLVLLVFLLAREVTGSAFTAATAAVLLALDGLAFVESRIAKPDIFLVTFLVAAYWAFWRYLRSGRVGWLYLSGAAAGMSVATKWTGAAPLGVIPFFLALLLWQGWARLPRRHGLHLVAAYGLAPLAVYLLAWTPYFLRGHDLGEWARFHVWMFRFHAGLTATHPYQSAWWSWPLLVRPIWYDYQDLGGGQVRGIIALGNVVVWWAALPALLLLGWETARRRTPAGTFVLAGFLASYLPYVFIGRALFLYHMLPALPFMVLALALALARVRARAGPAVVGLYLVAAALWFVAYYPLLSALPLAQARFQRLMWFGTWI